MSAVITLGIVLMWAVVLVPMWLRRHDKTVELQSVDRFAGAMRVLSRPERSVGDRRWVVMPARRATQTRPVATVKGETKAARRARGAGRQVRRRRRTLTTLVVLTVATAAVAVVLGGRLLYAQLGADVLLCLGLVRTRRLVAAERRRRTVRTRRDAALRAAMAAATTSARAPAPARAVVPATPAVARTRSSEHPGADDATVELPATGTESARQVRARPPAAPPAAAATAASTTQPRIVDLTRPGQWSEDRGRLIEEEAAPVEPEPVEGSLLDELLEHRRAVNG